MSLKEVQQSNCNNEGKTTAQDFICPNCGDVHTYDFTLEACCDNTLNQ